MSEERTAYDARPQSGKEAGQPRWDAAGVAALRSQLGLTQAAFARALGVRQQTVSEWETGRYQPRGTSVRVLSLLAEQAAEYGLDEST